MPDDDDLTGAILERAACGAVGTHYAGADSDASGCTATPSEAQLALQDLIF